MCSIELPKYVLGAFQKEINEIKINLIKKICEDYYLDKDELIEQYICDFELINKNLENVQIIKRHNYNSVLKKEDRCTARIYNNGKGSQCKRSKNINNLCTLHNKLLEKNGNLKYGYITAPRPRGVFTNKNPKKESIY